MNRRDAVPARKTPEGSIKTIGAYGFVKYHRKNRNDVLFVVPIDVLDSRE